MKFEIDRMKFVLATEKFDRGVAELFRPGNKFDRDGMKFGVEWIASKVFRKSSQGTSHSQPASAGCR